MAKAPAEARDGAVSLLESGAGDRNGRVIDLTNPDEIDIVDDVPRRRRAFTRAEVVEGLVALLASLAFVEILRVVFQQRSFVGAATWTFLGFLTVYALLVRDRADTETAIDRVVTVTIWTTGALVVAALAWMLIYLVSKGLPALRPSFFTQDLSKVGPLNPGGGAKHAIIGTFEQVGIATVIVVPIAVLTAIYLNEIRGRLALPVRIIVDAMSGMPSIVAGLLVFTVWVDGHGFSGIAGSGALVVLMLPTVTRTSEEILRTIPDHLREGGLALGAPQWRLIMRVVVPTALAGLMTAVILGIAGPQADLPLFVLKLIHVPNAAQNQRAWTGALVLVMLVLVLFVAARLVTSRSQRKLGRKR